MPGEFVSSKGRGLLNLRFIFNWTNSTRTIYLVCGMWRRNILNFGKVTCTGELRLRCTVCSLIFMRYIFLLVFPYMKQHWQRIKLSEYFIMCTSITSIVIL